MFPNSVSINNWINMRHQWLFGVCLNTEDNDSDSDSDSNSDTPPPIKNNFSTLIVRNSTVTNVIIPCNSIPAPVFHEPQPHQMTLDTVQLKNPALISTITTADDKNTPCMNLFNNVVNFRNRNRFVEENQKVSADINCEYTHNQQKLLDPSALDTVIGCVMNDS